MAVETQDRKTREEEKVGVYVCHCGGNISDHVDVQQVCARARSIPGVAVVRDNVFMCSDPGQELIMEDLRSGAIDRVVVASCAPDLHETTFRNAIRRANGNPYIYEHANIREQVSWVHHGDQATNKATRLVAAAAAKAKGLQPLEPFRVEAQQHVTVVGGGVAGLRASLDLAERGLQVILIEKSPFLGGWLAHWDRVFPTEEPAADLLLALTRSVLNHPNVTVYSCSRIIGFDGYLGNFKLTVLREPPVDTAYDEALQGRGGSAPALGEFIPRAGVCPAPIPETAEEHRWETGAIVLATGFKPYTPRTGEYGYRDFEEVITLPELIRLIVENREGGGGETLTFRGRPVRSLALIHCVGSRQIPGIHPPDARGNLNEYCSRTCCSASLHAAHLIREAHPETQVFEFYRDIRAYGRGQEELYFNAARSQVVFFRFEPEAGPVVERNQTGEGGPLLVRAVDTLTSGEEIEIPVDLVVLAVGMEPHDVSDLVSLMKLPVGRDRFLLEVHPKLRPVELSVSGVLLAGTAQAPFDIGEACAAAQAAAVKASGLLGRGYVELDPFVAVVDLQKCRGTGACVEACRHPGALTLVEMEIDGEKVRRAQVNPALCVGGGTCVAVCPEKAINIQGWTLPQYEAMVDMIVDDQLV